MSKPTFNIANPIYIVNKSSDVDSRYGPWSSVEDANSNVNINIRDIGLTVGVSAVGVGVTEYWYKNGVQNTDLILKTTGGGGGGSADLSIFYNISSDWTSTTNTVCSLSANWNSVYSLVNTNSSFWNYRDVITSLIVGPTSYIIEVSSGNVFYQNVDRGQAFSYRNFDIGKTIVLYLSAGSSSFGNDFIQQFPKGTYFNNIGESNYLLTVGGKITKATITNFDNIKFFGSTEIFDLNQPTQNINNADGISLDGLFGYYLTEEGDRILYDNTPISPLP